MKTQMESHGRLGNYSENESRQSNKYSTPLSTDHDLDHLDTNTPPKREASPIAGDQSIRDKMMVKREKYIGFCVCRWSYLLWSPVIVDITGGHS